MNCGERKEKAYLGLLVDVPGEGDGVVGDLLDVADGVEALLVVRWQDTRLDVRGWTICAQKCPG